MREILSEIRTWQQADQTVALATLVEAWGSAPRPLGAKMAIAEDGRIAGSVSGGCVEGAVVEAAGQVLETGRPTLLRYGVSDETAWSVGLSCGGAVAILLERLDPADRLLRLLLADLAAERSLVAATLLSGTELGRRILVRRAGEVEGSLGHPRLDAEIAAASADQLGARRCVRRSFTFDNRPYEVFFDIHLPAPQLVVVGAVHVAIHLVAFAKRLGFRTVVVDPRTVFATRERFAEADELVVEWPAAAIERMTVTESTCFVFLSHDPKLDIPGLELALRSLALYVGALGSRTTHAKRRAELRELGFSDADLDTIHAPIGLDLGGRRAEEIALAIMAEIVAVQSGGAVQAR
jgi:xanthine dehydrogenase accessory factor